MPFNNLLFSNLISKYPCLWNHTDSSFRSSRCKRTCRERLLTAYNSSSPVPITLNSLCCHIRNYRRWYLRSQEPKANHSPKTSTKKTYEGPPKSSTGKQLAVGSGRGRKHEGFKCNLCSGDITGFRYTCVQCADFDICASCETRGAHAQHYVLRIPGPNPYLEVRTVLELIRKELLELMQAEDNAEAEDPPAEEPEADSMKVEVKEEADSGPDPLDSATLTDIPLSTTQPSDAAKPLTILDAAVEQIKIEVDTDNSDSETEYQTIYQTLTHTETRTPGKHSNIKPHGETVQSEQEKQTELGRLLQATAVQQKRKMETEDTGKLRIEIDTGTIVLPQIAAAKEDTTICQVFTHHTCGSDPGSGPSVSKIPRTGNGQKQATVSPVEKIASGAVRKKKEILLRRHLQRIRVKNRLTPMMSQYCHMPLTNAQRSKKHRDKIKNTNTEKYEHSKLVNKTRAAKWYKNKKEEKRLKKKKGNQQTDNINQSTFREEPSNSANQNNTDSSFTGADAELNSGDDITDDENETMYDKVASSTATDTQNRSVGSGVGRKHEGFKCNLCSGDITGFRYLCVQCPDFDICASCETRGAHTQHYVLRIPGPRPQAEIRTMLERIRKELLIHAPADHDADTEEAEAEDADADSMEVEVKEEVKLEPDPLDPYSTPTSSTGNQIDAAKPWTILDAALEYIKVEVDTDNSDTEIESQPTDEARTTTPIETRTPEKHSNIKPHGQALQTEQEKQTELGKLPQDTSVQQKRKMETEDTTKLCIAVTTGTSTIVPQTAGTTKDMTTCEVFTHRTTGSGASVSKIPKTSNG